MRMRGAASLLVMTLLSACQHSSGPVGASAGDGGDGAVPEASGRGRILSVDRTSGTPSGGDVVEPEVKVSRNFDCDEGDLATDTVLMEVDGASNESLFIRKTSMPCTYQLKYRAGASESALSERPSGY